MGEYRLIAPCHFGLESVLSWEVKSLGGTEVVVTDGRVEFSGDASMVARANICLRTAERVLLKLAEFPAKTFTELFDGVREIPFEDYLSQNDAFPVKGWSLKSGLFSIPDCQSIIKKAAVERMKSRYQLSFFPETGTTYQIRFSILRDVVTIAFDSSGVGLHKRGYRSNANLAPMKETLAAGIVDLARVKDRAQVLDPFCGSGTLLIEAATKALNVPPGLRRKFAAQHWGILPEGIWQEERTRGLELVKRDAEFHAYGMDIDPDAIALTRENAKKAGVSKRLSLRVADVKDFVPREGTITLTNPPYGERMLETEQAEALYRTMGAVFLPGEGRSYYVISPHERFENLFGRKANQRRKLYNGMLRCQLYQYYR